MSDTTDAIPVVPVHAGTISFAEEMKDSYLAYAMSVIISRALPDVRDGLKPVHRRILFGMRESGFTHDRPYRKSARAVGDVMGKYHPHGDSSIYDAMVRMAQTWNNSVVLIDGQGNFGSIDGDSPAAMRYTEARLARGATPLIADLSALPPDRADMVPNYDESEREPLVLPARYPNLLVNGGAGIAVGMATNIPTHNLGEVIDGTIAMMENPFITVQEMMQHIKGPDFPTGGIIHGSENVLRAYETGRGSIPLCGVYEIQTSRSARESIVITEIPFNVCKATLVESMGVLVNSGEIQGVTAVRDESDRKGMRIVVDVRRDTDARLVLNLLRKHTSLDSSFAVNAVCVDASRRPITMGLLEMLAHFIEFRRKTIFERSDYKLGKLRDRMLLQVALFVATLNLDEVVRRIRSARDRSHAEELLMQMDFDPRASRLGELLLKVEPDEELPAIYRLTPPQAEAIVRQRLSFLAAVEQDAVYQDIEAALEEIRYHEGIVSDPDKLDALMKEELLAIKQAHGVPRRTRILTEDLKLLTQDDLVEEKAVILTMTARNYVKLTPVDAFREQGRGGKGRAGMATRDNDFVIASLACSNKDTLLLFTNRGVVHQLKAYEIVEAAPAARGMPVVQYLPELDMAGGEFITTVMVQPEDDSGASMVFVTSTGDVRRSEAKAFSSIRRNGKIAIRLQESAGEPAPSLVTVIPCTEADDIVLYTSNAKAIRFPVADLRVFSGRESSGVRGVRLAKDARVLGGSAIPHVTATTAQRYAWFAPGKTYSETSEEGVTTETRLDADMIASMASDERFIMTVTENGFGKRFSSHDLRISARGGQGVEIGRFGPVTGPLVGCRVVGEDDSITLVTDKGKTIRLRASDVRKTQRAGRGVTLFDIAKSEKIVDIAVITGSQAEEE